MGGTILFMQHVFTLIIDKYENDYSLDRCKAMRSLNSIASKLDLKIISVIGTRTGIDPLSYHKYIYVLCYVEPIVKPTEEFPVHLL